MMRRKNRSRLSSQKRRVDWILDKISIIDLIILSKLENSKSEIRRLIKGNAVKINNQVVNDEKLTITKKSFKEKSMKLSLGKKRHLKVNLS